MKQAKKSENDDVVKEKEESIKVGNRRIEELEG